MATAADADDEAEAEDGGESGGGFVFCAFHIGDNRHSPRPAECTLGRE